MCPLPNQRILRHTHRISTNEYVDQVRLALELNGPCEMLCIYNDGSFFSNHELPAEARRHIYRLAVASGCQYFMVESLPVFVSRTVLEEAKAELGNVKLVVGMGLQSFDDRIRELCISSPVTIYDFLSAHRLLRQFRCSIKAYLLLKPPFLTEDESIQDCVRSANRLNEIGIDDITICPLRIGPATVVAEMYKRNLYAPPALSSVFDVLKSMPTTCTVRVSIFNVHSIDFDAIPPRTCDNCREPLLKLLYIYNSDPLSVDFGSVGCDRCSMEVRNLDRWLRNLSLEDRISGYMNSIKT
jgi:hypothetical protein